MDPSVSVSQADAFELNIAKIAKVASHKLPGKLSSNISSVSNVSFVCPVLSVCSVCPVCPVSPVCPVCPNF